MAFHPEDLITIVIPTRNRPNFLRRVFTYLSRHAYPLQILVADSSDPVEKAENEKIANDILPGRVVIKSYNDSNSIKMPEIYEKHHDMILSVTTPYLCVFADDDIIDIDVMLKCVSFLEKNKDYSACHGKYVGFKPDGGSYKISHVEYSGESFDQETVPARIAHFLMRYEAIFYTVFRTDVAQSAVNLAVQQKTPMFAEIAFGIGTVISGKVARLNEVYAYRWPQIGSYDRPFFWEPNDYLEKAAEEMFSELWYFRDTVANYFKNAYGENDVSVVKKVVEYGYMGYIMNGIDFEGLGRKTLPDYLRSELKSLFVRRSAFHLKSAPRGFSFFLWWLGVLRRKVMAQSLPKRDSQIGKAFFAPEAQLHLSASEMKTAAAIMSELPYMESGGLS